MSQPTTSEPSSNQVVRTSDKQIFCCKSIDKLITESESPGQRLQKTLGPWSLTALGIGAVIGSGIFVLTGTAAAGEYFQAPSILHAQVLDIVVNFLRGGGTAQVLMRRCTLPSESASIASRILPRSSKRWSVGGRAGQGISEYRCFGFLTLHDILAWKKRKRCSNSRRGTEIGTWLAWVLAAMRLRRRRSCFGACTPMPRIMGCD